MVHRWQHRLRFWFGLSGLVDRRAYLRSGLFLMGFKYVVDALVVGAVTGRFWDPFSYLHPFLFARESPLQLPPTWLLLSLAAWSIPFLWVGVSLTIRRAVDAGLSPWVGCLFFAPVINYVLMVALSVLPSRTEEEWRFLHTREQLPSGFRVIFGSAAAGAAVALALIGISVYGLRSYAAGLFLGTPFCAGLVTGFFYNRSRPQTEWATVGVVQLMLLLASGAMLLFALEGIVCLAMAYPLAVIIVSLGGVIGRMLALQSVMSVRHVTFLLVALPFLMGAEVIDRHTPLREVVSVIDIGASPQQIWPHVIGFSALPPPSEWVFRLGIAYPQRATIEGSGVGAVRQCEFSTGSFVEPISHWEEPTRLAFDVQSQPPPMHEWSPYRHISAPHLIGNLRTKHGEFRLIALPDGRTRLEGSTWYELEMFPQAYWTLWSDALVHQIHNRVLKHIRHLAEDAARAP